MAYSYPYYPYYYRNYNIKKYNSYYSNSPSNPYSNKSYCNTCFNNKDFNEQVLPENESNRSDKDEEREAIDIFGISLYYDDILLICLLFFLYNEGVKDQYLFISLILLLLS